MSAPPEEPKTGLRERSQPQPGSRPVKLAPPDSRPEIPIGVDIERMTNDSIRAIAADERVYQRAGMLSQVVTVPQGPPKVVKGVKRAPGSHVIIPLESGSLRERMSSAARWTKLSARRGEWVGSLPPEVVVSATLARHEWAGVRTLVSVATSPQLRPDGTILQQAGYDALTGILYWPVDLFPGVHEAPSLIDARGALEALREVCCDFPFARPEHESAWLAGLLTMLARPAIDGPVPLLAVDATTRGTGKSRLVDAAVRLALGHDVARTSLPDDDDEMRKRITSLMLEGDPAICLDNVSAPIAFPSLDAVLTSTLWKDRLLGQNSTVSVPARAVWWTTGNNLDLRGDLSRRSLHVRLESPLENPEERTGFKHPDLLRWVERERPRLVTCALTLLRAFCAAGAPYDGPLWGSFEEWSKLVPGALVWAGATSPLVARATADPALDDEKRALVALVDGLRRLCPVELAGARPLTAKAVLDALYPERDLHDGPKPPDGFDDLRDVIEQETRTQPGRKPEARRLGKWLQRSRGRVVSGWAIVRHEGASHTATWRAEPAGTLSANLL